MEKSTIQFQLDIEEANTILKALGRMPYEEVYQLIDKLQHQAQAQIGRPTHKQSLPQQ